MEVSGCIVETESFTISLSFVAQEVDEEDEKALTKFMSHNPPARRTLADIIQEKLTEKKTEIQSQMTGKSDCLGAIPTCTVNKEGESCFNLINTRALK